MLFIRCKEWEKFSSFTKEAKLIIYECKAAEGLFRICAVWDQYTLIYEESIPIPEIVEGGEGGIVDAVTSSEKGVEKHAIARKPIEQRFKCGLIYSITLKLTKSKDGWITISEINLDHSAVVDFLVGELNVSKSKIVQGSIIHTI